MSRGSWSLLAASLAVVGCGAPTQVVDIDSQDGGQWSRGLRLEHALDLFDEDLPSFLEFEASAVEADDAMHLESDEAIRIGGELLGGPEPVRLHHELRTAALLLRVEQQIHAETHLEVSLGLGWHDFEIEAGTAPFVLRDSLTSIGPAFGVGAAWEPAPGATLRVRAEDRVGFGAGRPTNLFRAQVGAEWSPLSQSSIAPSLLLGWHWTRFSTHSMDGPSFFDSSDSDIDLQVHGPLVEFGLRF